MSEENIYTTPKAELRVGVKDWSGCSFFPTSQKKLAILFIATFGIYTVYWFYKNWDLRKKIEKSKVTPVLRAIFYIFFTHSLFRKVENVAISKGISKSWSAVPLATLFVILAIVSNILDRSSESTEVISILDFASVGIVFILLLPIYMVQEVVNKINDDPHGKLNNSFSIYNFIFIILGGLFWVLVGVGLLQLDISYIYKIYG